MLAMDKEAMAVAPPIACSEAPYKVDDRYAKAAG